MQAHIQAAHLTPPLMLHALARNWWLLLLRGIFAIIFGALAFAWPGLTLVTLVLLYGAYALVDGICAVIAALMGGGATSRWWLAVSGLCGIGIGLMTFMWPGVTALVLLLFIASWAIVVGVFEILGAIRLRREIDNEWMLILSGAVSVLFGLALLAQPGAGALALVWVIGTFAILFGLLYVGFALRLRAYAHAAA